MSQIPIGVASRIEVALSQICQVSNIILMGPVSKVVYFRSVARVNGQLAVSRAFGDKNLKITHREISRLISCAMFLKTFIEQLHKLEVYKNVSPVLMLFLKTNQ